MLPAQIFLLNTTITNTSLAVFAQCISQRHYGERAPTREEVDFCNRASAISTRIP
jgi:hypothetical protein